MLPVPISVHGTDKDADAASRIMPGSVDTPLWCRGEGGVWFRRTLRHLGDAADCALSCPRLVGTSQYFIN